MIDSPARVVLCANGLLGARIADWLLGRNELVGIVLNAPAKQRDVEALVAEPPVPVSVWPADVDLCAALEPTRLVSVLFAHRLPPEWLSLGSRPPLNLHPGYLPWNRGADPAVWPIVDGSPAGTTLHEMHAAIDKGPIVAQRRVPVLATDTAGSLYRRLIDESWELFVETWPRLDGLDSWPQSSGGSHHRRAELASLDLTEGDLPTLDKLRARTFPPFGAEFDRDGRRYRVQVDIVEMED